jgi:tetratricopeptide (TPR) repeat protein
VPGYALLLAQQGETEAALELVEHALASNLTKLDRARFLPAVIQLYLETGDFERARAASTELGEIGDLARSDLFRAQSMHGRGRIALATDDRSSAIEQLKESVRVFTKLGLPYEAAGARADLGRAHIADGTPVLATMELRSAMSEFERLGSAKDAAVVRGMLESAPRTGP